MDVPSIYRAYAKINLYLDVLRKRRDGYHNIETVFQSVDLADELTFAAEPHLISLECSDPDLDAGDLNLVVRAAKLLRERSGCASGARIRLTKRIPVAAGLAGGSADAAAALIALNTLWGLDWPLARLQPLARELGADVAFCTMGGTVAATGRGDDLRPLDALPRTWFLLLHPEVAISTARVYNSPLLGSNSERLFAGKTASFRRALGALAAGDLSAAVFNRMESAVFPEHPRLAAAKRRLLEAGCAAAAMSGSGSTIFGICESREQAAHIADAFKDYRTSIVATVPAGVERFQ